ncbi:ABC transporter substrate-binding protein [Arthrobacter sp. NPDC093139]|uniref:ABC transporter substrate-binding protein n=1 Tax=Arthrobacter sp. NPDC093139 TaxID=3363945 RepID=UPI0038028DF9
MTNDIMTSYEALPPIPPPLQNISRRSLLKAAGLAGATALSLSGCAALGTQRENAVVFVSDGGEYQAAQRKAWLTPFQQQNPDLRLVEDVPKNYAKLKAMVASGNVQWDLMTATGDFGYGTDRTFLQDWAGLGLPTSQLLPEYVHDSVVGHTIFSNVIAYRTDRIKGPGPQSWADFFDLDKFPGKRALRNLSNGAVLEIALIADGVAPEDLYPIDFKRAFAKLDSIRKQTIFWTTGAQSAQLLADGEVSMAQVWNGRVYNLQKTGAPIAIQWNQHFIQADTLVIPRGANVEYAAKLAKYMLSAENNAKLSQYIPYGPTNQESLALVDKKMKEHLPTSHLDIGINPNNEWLNANRADVSSRWQKWVTSA